MKEEPIAIRPLEAIDIAIIEAAFSAIGWQKPAELFERYLAERDEGERRVYIATVRGAFAGYVTLSWRPSYPPFLNGGVPEIQDLNVLPVFQKRGIGNLLLDTAEAVAQSFVSEVGICVGLSAEYGAAQRLYVRRGYVPDGNGVVWRNRVVAHGDRVFVDDDLVLCLMKRLSGKTVKEGNVAAE